MKEMTTTNERKCPRCNVTMVSSITILAKGRETTMCGDCWNKFMGNFGEEAGMHTGYPGKDGSRRSEPDFKVSLAVFVALASGVLYQQFIFKIAPGLLWGWFMVIPLFVMNKAIYRWAFRRKQ